MNWIYSIVPIQSAFHPNEWIKMAQELKWTQENCHDIRIQMRRVEKGNVDEIEIKLSQKKISILIDFKQQIKLQVFYFRPNQNRVNEILFGMKRKANESYDLSEKISIGSSQFHWLWFHSPINNAIAFMSQHSSEKMNGNVKEMDLKFFEFTMQYIGYYEYHSECLLCILENRYAVAIPNNSSKQMNIFVFNHLTSLSWLMWIFHKFQVLTSRKNG